MFWGQESDDPLHTSQNHVDLPGQLLFYQTDVYQTWLNFMLVPSGT